MRAHRRQIGACSRGPRVRFPTRFPIAETRFGRFARLDSRDATPGAARLAGMARLETVVSRPTRLEPGQLRSKTASDFRRYAAVADVHQLPPAGDISGHQASEDPP